MATATAQKMLDGKTKEAGYGTLSVYVDGNGMNAVVFNVDTQRIVRSFRGETAWSDSERYASDLYYANREKYSN